MDLQKEIAKKKDEFQKNAPDKVRKTMAGALAELKKSSIADHARGKGERAPDFELVNTRGKLVGLGEMLKKGPVVLGFYRGRW